MESPFCVFALVNGTNKEIDLLLENVKRRGHTIDYSDNIADAVAKLNNGKLHPECLLFDYQSFCAHRQDIISMIEDNAQLQGIPVAVVADIDNNDHFTELDNYAIKVIPLPSSTLIFRQRVCELAELGRLRAVFKKRFTAPQ